MKEEQRISIKYPIYKPCFLSSSLPRQAWRDGEKAGQATDPCSQDRVTGTRYRGLTLHTSPVLLMLAPPKLLFCPGRQAPQ